LIEPLPNTPHHSCYLAQNLAILSRTSEILTIVQQISDAGRGDEFVDPPIEKRLSARYGYGAVEA
jgi:hypothetical protein